MPRHTPGTGVPCPRTAEVPLSQRIATALQSAPEPLDEIKRARLERNLIEAWRARGAHAVPLPRFRPALSRGVWIGSLAVSAALGVAVGVVLLRDPLPPPTRAVTPIAHFDLVIGDGAVQSGSLVAGQVLESGKRGHIEVTVEQSRLDIAPESRVRFERLDRDEVRVSLVQGRVDVAFHPERKGEQELSIETSTARIVVVGTRFSVEASANRETRVRVSEGVVRVQPRRGGAAVLVRAGEELAVPAQPEPQAQPSKVVVAPQPAQPQAEEPAPAVTSSRPKTPRAKPVDREDSADALEVKLEHARGLLLRGKHAVARVRLERIVKSSAALGVRVEALMLMAESYTAQGQVPRAAATYRRAVEVAPRETAGHNALFALARLLDRYTDEDDSAAAAYREYLAKAPHGALARQAREALCRLSKCR